MAEAIVVEKTTELIKSKLGQAPHAQHGIETQVYVHEYRTIIRY